MSDSVTKYFEQDRYNDSLITSEEKRDHDILELIALSVKAGKVTQVAERAKEVQKEYVGASLLVGLQIACDEEGII